MENLINLIRSNDKNLKKELEKVKSIDINNQIGGSATLLCFSCFFKNLDAVKFLIENKKADINKQSTNGNTPFRWACTSGASQIIEYLLIKKADLTIKDEKNRDGLFAVCDNIIGIETFERCLRYIDEEYIRKSCNIVSDEGSTLLSSCIQSHRSNDLVNIEDAQDEIFSKIEFLISMGANPKKMLKIVNLELSLLDFVNNNKLTSKYPKLAENLINFLIELGLTGKECGKDSNLFYEFSLKGDLSVIKSLMDIGYDINKTYDSKTPIMGAIENNNIELSNLLIKHGANLKKKDKEGRDVLFYALETDFNPLTLNIIDLVNIKTRYSKSYKTRRLIIPPGHNALHIACLKKNFEIIVALTQKGLKIDEKGDVGISPLDILNILQVDKKLIKFLGKPYSNYKKYANNIKNGKIFGSNQECPICMEILSDDITILKCGHIFHTNCIFQHLSQTRDPVCPVCRSDLELEYKVKLPESVKSFVKNQRKDLSFSRSGSYKKSKKNKNYLSLSTRSRRRNSSIISPPRNSLSKKARSI